MASDEEIIVVGDRRNDLVVDRIYSQVERDDRTYYACMVQSRSATTGLTYTRKLLTKMNDEIIECGNIKSLEQEHYNSLIDKFIQKYDS